MKREKNLIKNSLFLLLGQVFPKLTFFIILPILTAYLSKLEYGTYDLISILQALLIPIITLQVQVAAFRYLIENKDNIIEKKKIITNILLFLLFDSIFLFLILFISLFKYDLLLRFLIIIYIIIEMSYNVIGQVSRGLLDTKGFSYAGIIYSLVNLILTFLFIYYLKAGLYGLLLCLIISTLIPIVYLVKKNKIIKYYDYKLKSYEVLKMLLNYSWPMIPHALSMWIINASDRLMISIFLGIEFNAIYAVARKIPNIINLVQGAFHTAWVESASLADKDSDSDHYYSRMFDIVFRLTGGLTFMVAACTPILFLILIRGDYEQAYNQLPILIFSMLFFSMSSFLGGIYTAKKKTKNVGFTTIIAALINIIINYLLIKKIGLYAASISTLISYIVLLVFRMFNVKKFIKITYNYNLIIIIIIISLVSNILLYFDNIFVIIFNFLFSSFFAFIFNIEIIKSFIKKIFNRKL